MTKEATVYILGAGATRGAFGGDTHPPVDKDFFDIAKHIEGRGTPELANRVLDQVWDLYKQTSEVSLEYYFRDIESRNIFTNVIKSLGQPKKWENRLRDLRELICRIYIQTTCTLSNNHLQPRQSKSHKKILHKMKQGDVIVTFNYDLVIEESFVKSNHQHWNPRYGYGVEVSHGLDSAWARRWINSLPKHKRKDYRFPKSNLILLKLHGSLNWRINKYKRIILKPYPFLVSTSKGHHPRRESVAIIPPSILKDITETPYSKIWQIARRSLENCQTIVIIGYSLPETDFMAHSLLNEVVRSRLSRNKPNYLKMIHLVDPDVKIIDKFVSIFTPVLGARGKIYKYKTFNDFCSKWKG